jgi:hypothetical protein
VELTVVREFIRDRRHEAVMLLRADDAEVEGISSLHGFIHVRGRSAIEIADLIERRLGQPGQQATRPATVSNQVLLYQTGSREQWSPPATRDGGFAQLWAVANASFSADVLEGSITPGRLRAAACLVLAIGPARTTHFDEEEFDAIRAFVRDGHGLLLLGTYHGDRHHIANLTSLAKTFDIGFNSDVLLPTSADPINAGRTTNNAIDLTPAGSRRRGATPLAPRESRRRTLQELLLRDVKSVRTRDTCSLQLGEDAVDLLWSIAPNSRFVVPYIEDTPRIDHDKWATRSYEPACVAAASTRARVVVCGGWRTFSTTFLGEEKYDNQGFLTNVLQWLTVSQAT